MSPEQACRAKRVFNSAARAQTVADFESTDVRLHVYQCPVCDGWHLTKRDDG